MKTGYGVLKMEVSPHIEQQLKELFDIETEMLEAEVEYLPNNLKRLTVQVPLHKGGVIKNFILQSIAGTSRENLN